MDSPQTDQPAFVPTQPAAPTPTTEVVKSNRKRTIAALWLMIGPTALIVISIIAYAVVNFLTLQAAPETDAMFGEQPVGMTIMNIILFLVGAISVITWLPGLIIGIVLLATKKR